MLLLSLLTTHCTTRPTLATVTQRALEKKLSDLILSSQISQSGDLVVYLSHCGHWTEFEKY